MSAVQEAQSLNPSAYIELFKLEHPGLKELVETTYDPDTGVELPKESALYFINTDTNKHRAKIESDNATRLQNGYDPESLKKVRFGGKDYIFLPVELKGIEFDGGGAAQARPTLTLGIVGAGIYGLLPREDYFLGARLTVSRIFENHFDNDDAGLIFGATTFTLDRMTQMTKESVNWELRSILDFEGYKLPRRFVSRDYCPNSIRRWIGPTTKVVNDKTLPMDEDDFQAYFAGTAYEGRTYDEKADWVQDVQCPYDIKWTGPFHTENGEETFDPTKEHFARTLKGCCSLRAKQYIKDGEQDVLVNDGSWAKDRLPFGGFPGAER